MVTNKFSVVVLAAGKGTRMYSNLPKVLHFLAGKPMIQHIIDTVLELGSNNIYVVYGHCGELLKKTLVNQPIKWVHQSEQLGTGHAMQQVAPFFADDEDILLLYGDVPLISVETLKLLIQKKPKDGIGLLTVIQNNPDGYGRVIKEQDEVVAIVEHKDATEQQREIKEINTGILLANGGDLKRWLSQLTKNNSQGEYYLTDIIAIAHKENRHIEAVQAYNFIEVEGVNNRQQLARLERIYQKQQADKLLLAGVMLLDPNRFDLRGTLHHGLDVTIDANVLIQGEVTLGNNVYIGMGCVLRDCVIGDNTVISPYSVIEESTLAADCTVGPFARLRPGSVLKEQVHIGNFVEVKKSQLGKGTKAGHLSYLGDAEIGEKVNIGAGTITCNYDGANKHKTIIADDVFVGSDTQFIAPVVIEKGATIGAGTTVTKNVSENELVLSRTEQLNITGWQRPIKKSRK